MSNYIKMDKVEFDILKNLYESALKRGEDKFSFRGSPVLVTYAKYLIEYLEKQFEKES
jgi:hypothetical protein